MKKPVVKVVVVGGSMEGNVNGTPELPADRSLVEAYCIGNNVGDRLGVEFQFSIYSRKDSGILTDEDRQTIAEAIRNAPAADVAAVIVVHGKGTMRQTINTVMEGGPIPCPIAFVSAEKPMGEAGSDGPLVFGAAVDAVQNLLRQGSQQILCFS